VRIGGSTETEVRCRTRAAEDGLAAARAARGGGIVPGAGATLLAAAATITPLDDPDERAGGRLVAMALEAPARALADGAGLEPGSIVELMRRAPAGFGPDVRGDGTLCDLAERGIVDSADTLCAALESAAYYAKRVIGAEALVVQPIYAGRYEGTAAEGGPANLTMR
jgi:chaperonin GroEL